MTDQGPDDKSSQQQRASAADAERFACCAARLLADSHCEDLLVLDLRGLSQVTDYFVIATGTSDRQILSVSDDLKKLAQLQDYSIFTTHGRDSTQWVVVDCLDVVIHLFDEQVRDYYDLESLWGDGKAVDWESVTQPGQFVKLGRADIA